MNLKCHLKVDCDRSENPNSLGWGPSPACREGAAAAAFSPRGPRALSGLTDPSWGWEETCRALTLGADPGRAAPCDRVGQSWVLWFWGSLPCPWALLGCLG